MSDTPCRTVDSPTIDGARTLVRQQLDTMPSRHGVLADNIGATLAEPLCAATTLPAADLAAMDGYAVAGDGPWVLRHDSQTAGHDLAAPLKSGEAIRIGTGARVPAGSSMVVRDEHMVPIRVAGSAAVALLPDVPLRDDTRRRGENWCRGAELVPAGSRVSLAVVSTATAAEAPQAAIRGRLRAGLIMTGDEIRADGELAIGQTRDSLGVVVPHYLQTLDIDCIRLSYVGDHQGETRNALAEHGDVDVVFVVGATRHGPADYLRPALRQLSANILIDGLQCRPGGTQLVATLPGGPVIHCLPGNPFAALAALLILAPAIVDALTSRTPRRPRVAFIPDATDVAIPESARVLPATATTDGGWCVHRTIRTPHLAGLIGCDALALIPARNHASQPIELIAIPA